MFKWNTWRNQLKVVLIIRDDPSKINLLFEKNLSALNNVSVITDTSGKLSKSLNAFFIPRAYGFAKGKLVWLQKDPTMSVVSILQHFLEKLQGKEKARALINAWSAEMRQKLWNLNQLE